MTAINYFSVRDEVWVRQPHLPDGELFLKVYPTDTSGQKTTEEQAKVIARILNEEA